MCLAHLVAAVAAGQGVSGFGNGRENIAADTLIQRAAPREMLGRLFGLVSTAAIGGSVVAYAAGGFLLDHPWLSRRTRARCGPRSR